MNYIGKYITGDRLYHKSHRLCRQYELDAHNNFNIIITSLYYDIPYHIKL